MSSVFTKIIQGEIPCYKITEDDSHFAFLDVSPIAIGHTLVVPKKEIDYIFNFNEAELSKLFCFAQKVAKGLKSVVACKRIGIAVIGLEVAHAHVHLVPLNSPNDIDFSKNKLEVPTAVLADLAKTIQAEVNKI
ncbi:MAG: HIT family protein [Bacteroidales bacterium]